MTEHELCAFPIRMYFTYVCVCVCINILGYSCVCVRVSKVVGWSYNFPNFFEGERVF